MPRFCQPVLLLRSTALLLLVSFCVPTARADAALPQPHKEHKRDYKREIEALEEQWRTAQLTEDVLTMERLLAPDYLGITMTGQVVDRTQQLDRMRSRHLLLTRIDLSDKKIKIFGAVAIVTSLAQIEGTSDGASMNGMFRYTRIYRRYSDGSWKITNFEVTSVPAAQDRASQPS
jgi:ketosteroid isomerase-like protein